MYTYCIQSLKILDTFCSWAGWFESNMVENPRRHIFAWCGSIVHWQVNYYPDTAINFLSIFVICPSLLLSSFHCPLQSSPCQRSWDVAIPSEFPFLRIGYEVIMYSKCILDPAANVLIRDMVFVRKCSEVSDITWATITRKPVFGVCDQVRHKPACSATEAC